VCGCVWVCGRCVEGVGGNLVSGPARPNCGILIEVMTYDI
jgi:hypothetical protein